MQFLIRIVPLLVVALSLTAPVPAGAGLKGYQFDVQRPASKRTEIAGSMRWHGDVIDIDHLIGFAQPKVRIDARHRVLIAGLVDLKRPGRGMLVRVNASGRLDRRFGVRGIARYKLPGAPSVGSAGLVSNGDSLIVLAAGENIAGGRTLTGFTPDGKVDKSFGVGGMLSKFATTDGQGQGDLHLPEYVDAENLVAPTACGQTYCMIKLDRTGKTDPAFAQDGRIAPPPGYWYRRHLVISGRIYVAYEISERADGTIDFYPRTNSRIAVRRYMQDGAPDPGFGTAGEVILPRPSPTELTSAGLGSAALDHISMRGATVDRRGRIVLVLDQTKSPHATVYRLKFDGSLDSTFGEHGRRWVSWRAGEAGFGSVTTDSRSRIILGGGYEVDSEPEDHLPLVVRLDEDGSRDRTWPFRSSALGRRYGRFVAGDVTVRGRWLYFKGGPSLEGNFKLIRVRYPR